MALYKYLEDIGMIGNLVCKYLPIPASLFFKSPKSDQHQFSPNNEYQYMIMRKGYENK